MKKFTLLFLLLSSVCAWADQGRYALVIGNAAYPTARLANSVNDATDMSAKLKERGFAVTQISDATQEQMEAAIETFTRTLGNRDTVGLFYYAGHGLEVGGENYLVPIDAKLRAEADVKYKTVNAGLLLDRMAKAGNGLNLVILDACRNNPFKRGWRGVAGVKTGGLSQMQPAAGTLILYATEPHKQAADGDGCNGTFTKHLLAALNMPGVQVEEAFKQVSEQVMSETGKQQIPWFEGVIHGRFYFIAPQAEQISQPAVPIKPGEETQPPAQSLELAYWQSTEKCGKPKCFKAYLKKYPHGEFVELAEANLDTLLLISKPTGMTSVDVVSTSKPSNRVLKVKIVDAGKQYSTLNLTECVKDWPSQEIKELSGSNGWHGKSVYNGDVGELVGEITHCDSGKIYLVKLKGMYVPIGKLGVTILDN